MCFDGNSAPLSSTYLNSQLASLWKNAVDCAHDSHIDINTPEYHKSKYTRALSEYHYIGENAARVPLTIEELSFFATFDKPELKFVCNHEVVLDLSIKGGHVRIPNNGQKANGSALHTDVVNTSLHPMQVAFRIPFVRTNVRGHDSKIGNESSSHLIQMLVLQMHQAKLVKINFEKSWDFDVMDSFTFHLLDYLASLQLAGNHVFFDLPDFAAEDKQTWTDYALLNPHIEPDEYCKDITISGITPTIINNFLKTQWTNAKDLAQETGDYLATSLSEFSTNWLSSNAMDSHFYIRFGAPHIKPLCQHEVVLIFEVKDVAFFSKGDFENSEPTAVHHGWTVAFIVNVVEFDSKVGLLSLDFETARFSRAFSTSRSDSATAHYFDVLVKFLSVDYLDILLLYGYNVIYRLILDKPASDGEDSGVWKRVDHVQQVAPARRHGQSLIWIERTHSISLSDADQVLALNEDSINRIFFTRWEALGSSHLLSTWTRESFKAKFDALSVRLLSNGKAIVYVDVLQGETGGRVAKNNNIVVTHEHPDAFWLPSWHLPDDNSGAPKSYVFEEVSLAFEVDLQLVASNDLDVEERVIKEFQKSIVQKTNLRAITKHLVLSLKDAKFIPELSHIHNLGPGKEGQKRLEVLRSQIDHYLKEVFRGGHGVIKTIPTFVEDHADPLAFNDISFKVLTKENITIGTYVESESRTISVGTPIVVIFGVCTKRKLSTFTGKWSLGWLPSGTSKNTVGTVWFSRESFLGRRFLHALEPFNARTTIVPTFAGIVNGAWNCDFTTWDKHELHAGHGHSCQWQRIENGSPRFLEYAWDHHDDWNNRDGDSLSEGEYSLVCQTTNRLRIPTDHRPGHQLEVQLKGQSIVQISGHSHNQRWSKRTVASWSATISIASRHGGLHVSMTHEIKPAVLEGDDEADIHFPFNIESLHRERLPEKLNVLEDLLPQLKESLEGPWAYSSFGIQKFSFVNPVFTRNGDFVLEIYPHEPGVVPRAHVDRAPAPIVVSTPTHASNGNGIAVQLGPKPTNGRAITPSNNGNITPLTVHQSGEFVNGTYRRVF